MDLTSMTGAIDLAAVGTAILAVGALKVVPTVIQWGASRLLAFIRR